MSALHRCVAPGTVPAKALQEKKVLQAELGRRRHLFEKRLSACSTYCKFIVNACICLACDAPKALNPKPWTGGVSELGGCTGLLEEAFPPEKRLVVCAHMLVAK